MRLSNINLVNDVGAPAAVTFANLAVKTMKPEWEEYVTYGITAAGYLSLLMGWGGDFMKNVGIAEFPTAAEKLYDRIKGATSTTTARVSRPVMTRSIRQTPQPGFQEIRPLY